MTEPAEIAPSPEFEFSAGALCLDFVNTLADRPRCREEKLGEFTDLLGWAAAAEVVDATELASLRRRAAKQPGRAQKAFRDAIELREGLYRIFSGLAAGEATPPDELAALNVALREALPHLRLGERGDGVRWHWAGPAARLDRILWPVTRSAAELLTSADVCHLRECASDRCSWVFIDNSRTRRRRWCDMKTCGNRAKARRHYARHKHRDRRH
jgi:predicted RNA-binding Zn ribbon-like protein